MWCKSVDLLASINSQRQPRLHLWILDHFVSESYSLNMLTVRQIPTKPLKLWATKWNQIQNLGGCSENPGLKSSIKSPSYYREFLHKDSRVNTLRIWSTLYGGAPKWTTAPLIMALDNLLNDLQGNLLCGWACSSGDSPLWRPCTHLDPTWWRHIHSSKLSLQWFYRSHMRVKGHTVKRGMSWLEK